MPGKGGTVQSIGSRFAHDYIDLHVVRVLTYTYTYTYSLHLLAVVVPIALVDDAVVEEAAVLPGEESLLHRHQ